jgi:GGDEF domain-containing protein
VNDFIGHAGGDNFIVVTNEESAYAIREKLKSRFTEQVRSHYNFMDREQGFITTYTSDGQVVQTPLMSLAIGIVSPSQTQFADIREITELAAEARRQDAVAE